MTNVVQLVSLSVQVTSAYVIEPDTAAETASCLLEKTTTTISKLTLQLLNRIDDQCFLLDFKNSNNELGGDCSINIHVNIVYEWNTMLHREFSVTHDFLLIPHGITSLGWRNLGYVTEPVTLYTLTSVFKFPYCSPNIFHCTYKENLSNNQELLAFTIPLFPWS